MKDTIPLAIVGSGPAGLTAGIYAARANLQPILFQGSAPGGQLMGTSIVENWPGTETILGPTLMIAMQEHAKKAGVAIEQDSVTRITPEKGQFVLHTQNKQQITAQSVIIATGASPNRLRCPGEDMYWGKGVTSCAVCDATLYAGKKVIIVGGGDSAMESASFLRRFTSNITIVHILKQLTASYVMQQRVQNDASIKVLYESTVTAMYGDDTRITEVEITNQKTGKKERLPADGVFLAIGLTPNSALFKDIVTIDQRGYIVIHNGTQTSVEGIFAAGDVVDGRYRQAITAAGSGCMAALDAERYLQNMKLPS